MHRLRRPARLWVIACLWLTLAASMCLPANSTLALATADPSVTPSPTVTPGPVPIPPAIFYGAVLSGPDFTPRPDTDVTAWINGNLCGQAKTQQANNEVTYSIRVLADGPGKAAGCGGFGRSITFRVDSQIMSPTVEWDNSQLWEVALRPVAPVRPAEVPEASTLLLLASGLAGLSGYAAYGLRSRRKEDDVPK